ncbi:MAG: U32 family peptidase [Lachnospiraceae bacterium]|nr:U32 family peptidase [Lachnospiraceae bacterium]
MINIPELLCPAGNKESFYAAINNGADAVYLGGKLFNARQTADNFTDTDFEEILDYAHVRGSKIALTLNTLYKNSELKDVFAFAVKMYLMGVDSFIVQDIGTAMKLKEYFPDIKLSASTQMSVHSLDGIKYFEKLGFQRVVLSRELSLKEIEHIKSNTNIEIETFIHGALCVCYSGQCLMSSLIGGRSGNRGRCAQPCRMVYSLMKDGDKIDEGYLLSPRDMMTLPILEDLAKAGINSLKIEGRMKSPEYVALVTRAYREALDRIKSGEGSLDENAVKDVAQIFNRGGSSTTGYYYNYAGSTMMSKLTPKSTGLYIGTVINYRDDRTGKCAIKLEDSVIAGDGIEIWTASENHAGAYINKAGEAGEIIEVLVKGDIKRGDKVYKSYGKAVNDKGKNLITQSKKQLEIEAEVSVKINEPVELLLRHKDITVRKQGELCTEALNKPLDEERIIAQLSKTGNTPYALKFKKVNIDGNIFVNLSSLNNLRREAIEEFQALHLNSFKKEAGDIGFSIKFNPSYSGLKRLTAKVENENQLKAAVLSGVYRVYYPICEKEKIQELLDFCIKNNCEFYLYPPRISRNDLNESFKSFVKAIESSSIDGYLVSTFGELHIIREISKKKIILDHSFNIFNSLSQEFYKSQSDAMTLSMELNVKDMQNIDGENTEIVIYGSQVMMATHQCPVGLYAGQKEKGKFCSLKGSSGRYFISDRKGEKFEVLRDCDNCIAYILNSHKLSVINRMTEILDTNFEFLRLSFLNESEKEVREIVLKYKNAMENGENDDLEEENLTYGHFFRGVE